MWSKAISRFSLLWALSLFSTVLLNAQGSSSYQWWNPAEHEEHVLEGQGWPDEVDSFYYRLPGRMKSAVRNPVWNLSKHSAGLSIRFQSNASDIHIRYKTSKRNELNHIPETGVRGVDLYAIDNHGRWMWSRPARRFGDTITYRYQNLNPHEPYHDTGREYRLYLPYFSSVEWLEVGVPSGSRFVPLNCRREKPIVVYGTSIAHGACASRPGMTWTNILGRRMDRPLINLAFSGNGRLEMELIQLIAEIDAKVFILDCLPNLWNARIYDDAELTKRITESIRYLKKERPEVPIILTEHAGYTDEHIQLNRGRAYTRVNAIQALAYKQLLEEGISGIYYLTKEELGLDMDDMVDGTHPNDRGMAEYAQGYEKKLRDVLNEPTGSWVTTKPVTQNRDASVYDWVSRHQDILQMKTRDKPAVAIFGNSIMHFWGGLPTGPIARDKTTWDSLFTVAGVRNFAFGWDRIENVLWRVYHDELDDLELDKVVLAIGTNNLGLNTDEEILEGLNHLIQNIRIRQPKAELCLLGILPRRNDEKRIQSLNVKMAQLAGSLSVQYADIGHNLMLNHQQVDESLFLDGLHPNEKGYKILADQLWPLLQTAN